MMSKTGSNTEKKRLVAILTLTDEAFNGYMFKMFRDLDRCILQPDLIQRSKSS